MNAVRITFYSLVVLALSISAVLAQVPNITAADGNICTGITAVAVPSNSTFTYSVTVSPGAAFNGNPALAVRDLIVYPNAGNPTPAPTSINAIAANWVVMGFNVPNAGFGYGVANQPLVNGVLPGQTKTIGNATFPALPSNQVLVAHVIFQRNGAEDSGFCRVGEGVILEPGTMALAGLGLVPMLLRRRRK